VEFVGDVGGDGERGVGDQRELWHDDDHGELWRADGDGDADGAIAGAGVDHDQSDRVHDCQWDGGAVPHHGQLLRQLDAGHHQ
jgi:hypothetical protein